MAHIYQLDLATILTVLAEQTGRLSTTGVVFPGIQSPCEVVVSVVAGQVQECRVVRGGHSFLMAGDALRAVLALGVLSWTYAPDVPPLSPPDPTVARLTSDFASVVPQRTRVVSPGELATWPRLSRSLYQLIDGKKSLDQLAHLLTQRLDVVIAGVMQLQQRGVLRLASHQQRQERVRQKFSSFFPSVNEP